MSAGTSKDEISITDVPYNVEIRTVLTHIGQKFLYPEFKVDFTNITPCIDLTQSELSEALLMAYCAGYKKKNKLNS